MKSAKVVHLGLAFLLFTPFVCPVGCIYSSFLNTMFYVQNNHFSSAAIVFFTLHLLSYLIVALFLSWIVRIKVTGAQAQKFSIPLRWLMFAVLVLCILVSLRVYVNVYNDFYETLPISVGFPHPMYGAGMFNWCAGAAGGAAILILLNIMGIVKARRQPEVPEAEAIQLEEMGNRPEGG